MQDITWRQITQTECVILSDETKLQLFGHTDVGFNKGKKEDEYNLKKGWSKDL